jgi:hypothetical protein
VLPILPILQTMFKKEIRAIVAGRTISSGFLLHEPDIVGVLPDKRGEPCRTASLLAPIMGVFLSACSATARRGIRNPSRA